MSDNQFVSMKIMPYHVDCLEYLKTKVVAPIPRAICQGRALKFLYSEGLIDKTGARGFWAITDRGKTFNYSKYLVDRPAKRVLPKSTFYIEPTPPKSDANDLLEALDAVSDLHSVTKLFGDVVKTADKEFLDKKSVSCRFVYFSYPLGYPLKHIGWALRSIFPNISDQYISTIRINYLSLPSRRGKIQDIDKLLFKDLIDEGLTEDEIREYFSSHEIEGVL